MKYAILAVQSVLAMLILALATGETVLAGGNWDGGGADNNWSTALNWSDHSVPANTGAISIYMMAGAVRTTPNVDVPWSIQSLVFNAGAAAFTVGGNTLTINNATGVQNNSFNLQTVNAPITLAVASYFDAYAGNLAIGGAVNNGGFLLTVYGPSGDTIISGAISGSGGLTKSEARTLTLSGASANGYIGTTTVSGGTLLLDKSVTDGAIAKDLVIGTGTVRLNQSDQISSSVGNTVTINSSGVLDLNTHNETIYNLTMTGGGQVIGTGASNLYVQGTVTTNLSNAPATISSGLILSTTSPGQIPFVVANGGAAIDLDVSGVVDSAGGGGMVKWGAGTMQLSGAAPNTFLGTTTVNEGVLLLNKAPGAGDAIAHDLVIGDGTGADIVRLLEFNQINDASNVTIASSGLLNLSDFNDTISTLTMTSGSVTTGVGTLTLGGTVTTNASGIAATISGNLSLNNVSRTFTIADGGAAADLDISAVISQGSLVKSGPGTLKFSGSSANTYIGTTTVNAGTLQLAKTGGAVAVPSNLTIAGGTVELAQNDQIAENSTTVTISSGGVLNLGAWSDIIYNLDMTAGTVQTAAGVLRVRGDVTTHASGTTASIVGNVNLDGGTPIFDIADGGATADMDISGVISSGGVTKTGPGTLRFSGSLGNTYGGATTVSQGTLELAKTGAIAVPGSLVVNTGGTAKFSGSNQIQNAQTVTISGGTLDLNGYAQTLLATLSMTGGSITTGAGTLTVGSINTNASATAATIAGNLALGSATRTFTVANGGATYDMDISAAISNGGIIKTGPGTLRFSGSAANTYTGSTTVDEGTLVLDKSVTDGAIAKDLVIGDGTGTDTVRLNQSSQISSSGGNTVTINSSGVLDLNTNADFIYNLTMTGGGQVIGTGLSSLSVTGTVTTNTSSATATISSGLVLNTAGQVPFVIADGGAAVDLDVSGVVNGIGSLGGLVKSGAGTMRLSGTSDNVYAGTTTVNEGVLLLNKTAGMDAIAHDLVIGDGTGGAGADVVRLGASNQIDNASNVAIASSGLLDLSGYSDTVGPLTMTSGSTTTGAGTLTLGGKVTTNAHASSATISGNVNLGAPDREFSVAEGAAPYDLDLSAVLSGGGLAKTGNGTLRLSGDASNSYAGMTTVNAGVLELAKTGGMLAVPDNLSINGGTVRLAGANQISASQTTFVNTGGTLDLNGFTQTLATLYMTGGSVTTGAGTLTVGSASITTNASATSATIAGNLNLGGATRTFTVAEGGATYDLDVSAAISNGGITKTGAGTLKLSGTAANTYTGTTTVNTGTLLLGKTAGVDAISADLVIGDGVGGYDADVVRLAASNQIPDSAAVNLGGLLDLAGYNETITTLYMNDGHITTGAGVLTLKGDVYVFSMSGTALISGNLDFNDSQRAFIVEDGDDATDIEVSGAIANGSLRKSGDGTLRLSGTASNTYTGDTLVSKGTLELSKSGAALAVAGDLTINNGGTVRLAASNQIADSQTTTINTGGTLTLNGWSDIVGDLVMNGGTITGSGTLTVLTSAVVNTTATPSTIGSDVSLPCGASGAGTLLKNGVGTLSLGADSNLGGVTLNAAIIATNANTLTVPIGGVFSQTGGTFTGALRSQGTFSYAAGTFGGRLINEGALSLSAAFTAGNGIQNFSAISLAAGRAITCNGLGLDNQSAITLAGGTLNGAATLTNNAIISGFGTVGGTGSTFTNNGQMTVSGGHLTLAAAMGVDNYGTVDVESGLQLILGSSCTFANSSLVNLSGSTLSGGIAFINIAGGTLAGRGTVTAPLFNSGGLLMPQGGTLSVVGGFTNGGEILLGGGASALAGSGTIDNTGLIRGDGRITKNASNNASGELRAEAGKRLQFAGTGVTNQGLISLQGGTAEFTQSLTNAVGGLISGRGTLSVGGAGLVNNGNIGLSGGFTDVYGDVANNASAKIVIAGGSTTTFYDDVNAAGGEIFVGKGCAVVFFGSYNGGTTGTGTVYMEGDLRPGHSPGAVTFEGDLFMGSGAALVAELAGTTPGQTYDVVDVGGTLALGGTLDVDLLYGFQPQAGQTFDILDFDPENLSGRFSAFDLPDLDGGLSWDTSNLYATGAIGVVPEPATLALVGLGLLAVIRRKLSR